MWRGEQILNAIYLTVIIWLAGSMHLPRQDEYALLQRHFDVVNKEWVKSNRELMTYMHSRSEEYSFHEPGLQRAARVNSIAMKALADIAAERYLQNKKGKWSFGRKARVKRGADSLQCQLALAVDSLLAQISSYDTEAVCKVMPLTREGPFNVRKEGSYNKMLSGQPPQAIAVLLSSVAEATLASEQMILSRVYENYRTHCGMRFDTIGAIAIPRSSFVARGDKLAADIRIGVIEKLQEMPTVSVAANEGVIEQPGGYTSLVNWSGIAHGLGLHEVRGTYTAKMRDREVCLPWKFSYVVGTLTSDIHLDATTFVYRYVDNPVSVGSGVFCRLFVASSPDAVVTTVAYSNFLLRPETDVDTVSLVVKGMDSEHKLKAIDTIKLAVRDMPLPSCRLAGVVGGIISREQLASALKLVIVPFDNDFQPEYSVDEYSLYVIRQDGKWEGPQVMHSANPGAAANLLSGLNSGDKLVVADVYVSGAGLKHELVAGCSAMVR